MNFSELKIVTSFQESSWLNPYDQQNSLPF